MHTPGPWLISKPGAFSDTEITAPSRDDKVSIAELDTEFVGPIGEEQEANARLIAAAPEMLAALKRTLTSRPFSIDYAYNRTPEACDVRKQIIDAIAKAGCVE